ncbi:hypothetical protein [Pedobacter cryotolerans]|uniref:DUF3828 domain-containing protein n=1 Tax=Pedobacter cryotolerans TaxID=2571270 RepID=A0A4U1C8L7_9SPHI|nr:hypothetical protein [Pedobacter cryotolerans]TKB99902.1 hypothetical protein FA045_10685 [Pedobacter cryotolerans]
MKKIILVIVYSLLFNYCQAQNNKTNPEHKKIKSTIVGFLKWYKGNEAKSIANAYDTIIKHRSIIVWEDLDSLIRPNIDMIAVQGYLDWLKSSNHVSDSFLNALDNYHQKIADEVKTYKSFPKSTGIFSIPGLNLDVIFGFEPEETLEYIDKGVFTKIRVVGYHALVQFDIPNHEHRIFFLSKTNNKWLIDRIEFNHEYYDLLMK